MNSKKSNRIPPLRVALYVFCAGMFAVMAILTIIGRIYGLFHPSFAAMAANTLLWLFPFVSRWLLKDGIGDGMLTICAVFIFFAGFFGTVLGFYGSIWWYDLAMHTLFGYLGAIAGLFFLCKLCNAQAQKAGLILLVCFAVSMMFAALWEIFEFSTDVLLSGTAQGIPTVLPDGTEVVPVNDTMQDILCNLCGALAFCAQYALHLFTKKSFLIPQMMRDFRPSKTAEKE